MAEAPESVLRINPAAAWKSIQERYNALVGDPNATVDQMRALQSELSQYVDQWRQMAAEDPYSEKTFSLNNLANEALSLNQRMDQDAENLGVIAIGRVRSYYEAITVQNQNRLIEETVNGIQAGRYSVEEGSMRLMQAGIPIDFVQGLAWLHGTQYDPAARPVAAEGAAPAGDGFFPPGEGDAAGTKYKSFKPIAADRTDAQGEFQKGFALFQAQLVASGGSGGRAPNLGVMNNRYQELYSKYIGELEQRKIRGEEDPNIFKDEYVNIGKNTDPQFETETDQFQLVTKRPKLSVLDYLAASIDPEDLYASTPTAERPGRTDGGYRGFVRRIAR